MFDMPLLDLAYDEPAGLASHLSGASNLLQEMEFTENRVVELLEAAAAPDLLAHSVEYALHSEHLSDDLLETPAGVLTQLFVRNGQVPHDVYRARLPRRLRDLVETLGLASVEREWVGGRASISLLSSRYYLSDQLFTLNFSENPAFRSRSDIVMPPHSSTMSLWENVERGGPWVELIDVGCGCGVLGIDLGVRYDKVTAVDCNPRAVAYTQANAILNAVDMATRTIDITKEQVPVVGPAHFVFNSPTTIQYRSDVREPGVMAPELALDRVLGQLLPNRLAGCLAQIYMIIEVPEWCASAEEVVAGWLAGTRATGFEVLELRDSPAAVTADMILTGSIEPRCLLLRSSRDAPVLADYLRQRRTKEVVPAVVSVWA
jgi:hypothetical protein